MGAAAHRCAPGGLAAQPSGVVSCGDEQHRGGVGADPVEGEQPGGVRGHQGNDERIEAAELAVKELRAASQLPQRHAGGVADDVARTRPQRRGSRPPAQPRCARANRARRSSGPVRIRALAWLSVWIRSERALRLATVGARHRNPMCGAKILYPEQTR